MRTRINEKKQPSKSGLNNRDVVTLLIIITSALLLVVFSIGDANAQTAANGKIGMSISSTVTGSGHGTNYSPQIHYSFNNNSISVGPNIQKRNMHLDGVQVNYERTICSRSNSMCEEELEEEIEYDSLSYNNDFEEDLITNYSYQKRVEAFLFFNSIYHNSAYLSQASMREQKGFNSTDADLTNLQYRTLENYVGFGLRIKLLDNLKWNNSVGFGGYFSSNGPVMLRMKNDAAIMVKTSLSFTF